MSSAFTLRNARLVKPDDIRDVSLHVAGTRVAETPRSGAWQLDLRHQLVFPGLINAHDHLQLNSIPPLPPHPPFPNSYAWVAAFQSHFRQPAVAAAMAQTSAVRHWQGGLKNLLCGATSVAHHDPWHPVLDDPDFPVRLLRRCGWSHSLGMGLHGDAAESAPPVGDAVAADRGRITNPPMPEYGPRVTESFAATPPGHPWIIHLAEGTDAIAASELGRLDRLGCLATNTVLVHAVGLSDRDLHRVLDCGASVIWCPGSNLNLLGRTIDPRRLVDAGRLALGSDSRLSGSRDLLDELRVAASHSDLSPAELLALVTTGSSRVLGWPEVGGLAPGQYADFLVIPAGDGDPFQVLLNTRRADIRAVALGGSPAITDIDLAEWFTVCGVETVPVVLDGRPKLLARTLLGAAAGLEPGLEISESSARS